MGSWKVWLTQGAAVDPRFEYRKDKRRPFQEGSTVYPPMEVGTSDPSPPAH